MTASTALSTLPPLEAAQAEQSGRLVSLIRRRIQEAGGWIGFERFMELALYSPGLGYYSAGSTKLGREGDFVTAPELSDLYSRCVARQCLEVLQFAPGGEILEFGAGSGRLAAVVLESLAHWDALPSRYAILEVSADLRARQQARIGALPRELAERVVWLDAWPQAPVRGVMLANEVLDALPCIRFLVTAEAQRVQTIGVGRAADGSLALSARAADAMLCEAVEEIERTLPEPFAAGYRSELCPAVAPWIGAAADHLEQGALLIFDYGLPRSQYYHRDRTEGTLRCYFRQRAHADPLLNVGAQDITAWVDFTRVAEAAVAAGLEVAGFTTQAGFLLGAGIDAALAAAGDAVQRARLSAEARQLLLPGEMGETFKAMALTREVAGPLSGFALQDLRASL